MMTSLIGASAEMQRIRDLIEHVAKTDLNTVISGESGVGKELVARTLYLRSNRNGKAFVKINCAALPETLLESELFGYERGAFTGADQKKRGRIELANGGVLMLDEIGDMSLSLQAKLLHVLQSGEFSPLGSEKEFKTDTWFIAATNQDLEQSIKDKSFREDLYYRLNVIRIYIPPLRERPEDIAPLVDYYVSNYAARLGNHFMITPGQMKRICSYPWPGNVRELQNVLKRMIVLRNSDEILDQLQASSGRSTSIDISTSASSIAQDLIKSEEGGNGNGSSISLKKIRKKALDRVEKEVISTILDKTGWNRWNASKILKISYKTLLYKIDELNLRPPENSKSPVA
ncbi:MAG: sigma-54 dependent transcriptional regulator [Thermodesulfobacteriota bacterium]